MSVVVDRTQLQAVNSTLLKRMDDDTKVQLEALLFLRGVNAPQGGKSALDSLARASECVLQASARSPRRHPKRSMHESHQNNYALQTIVRLKSPHAYRVSHAMRPRRQ